MSVINIINLKERIALSDDFSLEERKLLMRALDLALTRKPAEPVEVHNYLGRIEGSKAPRPVTLPKLKCLEDPE